VWLRGNMVADPNAQVPPEKRGVGMVFQETALFPHLTVVDNVAFGLHGKSAAEKQQIACFLLELVSLEKYADRYPDQLSGGEQHRVALARAMAPKPDLILLDEPFANLDAGLKERLGREVRDILRERGIAALLVTHDQHEAFAFADRIGVMNEGRVVQFATPFDVYHRPAGRFVAGFVGEGVMLRATLRNGTLETALGSVQDGRLGDIEAGEFDLLVRPDDVVADPSARCLARVRDKAFRGAETLYTLELEDGSRVLSLLPSHQDFAIGEEIRIRLEADHLITFR